MKKENLPTMIAMLGTLVSMFTLMAMFFIRFFG